MSTNQFRIRGQLISSVQKESRQIMRMKMSVSVDFCSTINASKQANGCLKEAK